VHKHKIGGEKPMGYVRGNGPGRGPFSDLQPWERPGKLYGRGACYYLYEAPNITPTINSTNEATLLIQQKNIIETQIENMQMALTKIQERLNEINK
jgi:hypothetical protein